MSSAKITILEQPLPGVLLLQPKVFGDARGFFLESYNEHCMAEIGIRERFVQDNHSYSAHNVLRGLHYQVQRPQAKLVRVAVGEILDVIVDLRRSSPQFGKSYGARLSGENKRMLWVPAGFAHGFCVTSESAHVLYKATEFYAPELERSLLWNDPALGIDWQLDGEPQLSEKDRRGVLFHQAETYE
ncbi:MAG TPA: dTDP-4-dehydrorhamnose 3,5-epimerase [Terriglobales bacterium]|nr:dTDP-4-dehydrorhamnose 3,5-epimerase [Terriglobales bacterium]